MAEESGTRPTWSVNRVAVQSKLIKMPYKHPGLPECGASSFDFDKWKLATHTVAIGDNDSPLGGEHDSTAYASKSLGRRSFLSRMRDCWLCPPFIWSSYDAPEERATRSPPNVVMMAVLRVFAVLMLAWQLAMTIFMAIDGDYDLSMYTFWNYTFMTVFCAFFVAALFYERFLLTFTLLFLFPPLFASVAVVRFGIVVIVGRNADVFLGDGSQSVEMRYVGDFVVHSLPLGMLLYALIAGLLMYVRRAIGYELGMFNTLRRKILYVVYVLFSGLVMLGIYTACFSIAKTYPTGIPTGLLWLALVGVDLAWMGGFLLIVVASYKGIVHFSVVTYERGVAEGRRSSTATESTQNSGRSSSVAVASTGLISRANLSVRAVEG